MPEPDRCAGRGCRSQEDGRLRAVQAQGPGRAPAPGAESAKGRRQACRQAACQGAPFLSLHAGVLGALYELQTAISMSIRT